MAPKAVSLPVRLGLSATRTTLNLTVKLTGRVAGEVLHVVGSKVGSPPNQNRTSKSARRSGAPASAASFPSQGPVTTPSGKGGPSTNGAGATVAEPTVPPPTPREAAVPAVELDDVTPPAELPDTPLTDQDAAAKTIDDEAEVVGESADRGAEDGAGAQIELPEPWEGYATANADVIISRIAGSDAAAVAIIQLYETAHKSRKTVLEAAEKRLRDLTPPGGE